MYLRRTHLVLALVAALAMPAMASADATFTFTGHGYGHGVGMGQYGAQGYALQGWTHEQILAHYYQGTTLGPTTSRRCACSCRTASRRSQRARRRASPPPTRAARRRSPSRAPERSACARTPTASRCSTPTGAVLAHGWAGPVSLAATRRRTRDARGRRPQRAARTGATAGACGCSPPRPPPAASRPSTSSRSRATCSGSSRARCRRPGSRRRSRRRRSRRAPTPWRPARPPRAPSTSIPTSAARSTAGSRRRARHPRPPWRDTAGQVVLYQGQPIVTYFSSSTGGRSANVEEGIPGADPEPYLVSVDDPYDTISPYHDWTLSLSDRDLSQKAIYPGLVTGLQVDAYPSGRVRTLTLNGSAGPLDALGGARAQAPGPALDLVHRDARGACREARVDDRAARPRRAQPRAADRLGAARDGDAAGRGARRLARPRHACGRRRRRRLVPAPRRRGVALPPRLGVARVRPGAGHPPLRPDAARAPGRAPERAALSRRRARPRGAAARHRRALDVGRARADARRRQLPLRACAPTGGRWRVRWRGAGSFLGSLSPELRVGARTLAWTPTDPLAAREWNLAAVNAFDYSDVLPALRGRTR